MEECEEERNSIQEKYNLLAHSIEELVNQCYQRYIKQEDVIPQLERLISG